jgi:IS5 family transposase
MMRMLMVGYCYGIRFERKLCEEVELNLAYRWFCRLGLDDKVPDHSTFSVNRHGRFRDSDIFRQLFEAVVKACMDAGLVEGEGFAVDASAMEADASRYHGQAPGEIDWAAPERQTNGKPLRTSGTVHDGRVRNSLSHPGDCRVCNLKERCTRAPFRKIARDINEEARDHARSLNGTPECEQSSNERKKVEMRFAHLKVHHGFERMRLRGLTGARDEFHLAAIVQNLKTLANHAWHPPPDKEAACAA